MKIYLVGGAVRDQLLGRTVKEKDWVVIGSTPEEMVSKGFKPVGKEFPVFLHPKTHEEYALARTEKKVGKGYKGFVFYTAPKISLEEDLKRRDLTVNAMAQTVEGELIDPFHGQQDIEQRFLRHVSDAFQEDPVRLIRVARFASELPLFKVHPSTLALMKKMVANGEVDALVPERVWQECKRALSSSMPFRFFEELDACEALPTLFPGIELETNKGFSILKKEADHLSSGIIRWALLLHILKEEQVMQLNQRYKVPKTYADLSRLAAKYHKAFSELLSTNSEEQLLDFILGVDALRRPSRFNDLVKIFISCYKDIGQAIEMRLVVAIKAVKSVKPSAPPEPHHHRQKFAESLREDRLLAIRRALFAD